MTAAAPATASSAAAASGASHRELLAAAILVAGSGWLVAQSFPLHGPRALAFVAAVPLFVCARTIGAVAAAALGAVWMLAFAWGINAWFARAVASHFELPWAGGFAAFLAVTLLTAAPATMAFAVVLSRLGPRPRAGAALVAAAAWTAGELLRVRVLGDPWGLLGHSQAAVPLWLQTADFAGVYGPGFVVACANAAVAEALLAARSGAVVALRVSLAALAVPVVAAGYGAWRLAEPVTDAPLLDVAVVQGNIDFRRQWQQVSFEPNLALYRDETARTLASMPARLVVWPENAVTFFLDTDHELRGSILPVLAPHDAWLLAGGPRHVRPAAGDAEDGPGRRGSERARSGGGAGHFRNSAFLLSPQAEIAARYDKERLLPFGEYSPLAASQAEAASVGPVHEFAPGDEEQPLLEAAGAKIGTVICNEALFPSLAARRVAAGATLLVALTNDSWVGEPDFAEQAFEQSILRAVEQRRWLVRSSTAGPSAVVDDRGRVVVRTPYGRTETTGSAARLLETRSVYSRVGDLFAIGCACAAVAGARRRRSGAEP